MRCHLEKWEDERIEAHNQECFNNVLETFFDEEELEFYGTEDIMWEIEELQKRYHTFIHSGYDMEDILNADEEDIITSGCGPAILDDMFNKNMFITKHKTHRRMMRNGKRVMGKRDSSLGVELIILRIEA
jgi:hypothetical protein